MENDSFYKGLILKILKKKTLTTQNNNKNNSNRVIKDGKITGTDIFKKKIYKQVNRQTKRCLTSLIKREKDHNEISCLICHTGYYQKDNK